MGITFACSAPVLRVGDTSTADASNGEGGPDERRAGNSGDEAERHVLATVIGVERHHDGTDYAERDADSGDEARDETAAGKDATKVRGSVEPGHKSPRRACPVGRVFREALDQPRLLAPRLEVEEHGE